MIFPQPSGLVNGNKRSGRNRIYCLAHVYRAGIAGMNICCLALVYFDNDILLGVAGERTRRLGAGVGAHARMRWEEAMHLRRTSPHVRRVVIGIGSIW